MITGLILIKGLIAAVIVGFVTASIKSWIDRVFLVIMLVGILGLPISQAIIINIIVVALAALLMVIRQRKMLNTAVPAGKTEWLMIVPFAFIGGIAGRFISTALSPKGLLILLGIYAILVGLRIFFIKPLPERETKSHSAWMAPIALLSGILGGFLSTGGKPYAVPAYNNAMGHHPQRAYAFASLSIAVSIWSALATQLFFIQVPDSGVFILGLYEFAIITVTALIVNRFWSQKLNKVVNLTIAPILIIVGIKFIIQSLG